MGTAHQIGLFFFSGPQNSCNKMAGLAKEVFQLLPHIDSL